MVRPDDLFDDKSIGPFVLALLESDPYTDDWDREVAEKFDVAADALWLRVSAALGPVDSPDLVLRNAWALASGNGLHLAALARAARRAQVKTKGWAPLLRKQADDARKALNVSPHGHWAEVLLGAPDRALAARPGPELSAAVSLRHALAYCVRQSRYDPVEPLQQRSRYERLSRHGYQRELQHMVECARPRIRHIPQEVVPSLPLYQRLLLFSSQALASALVPDWPRPASAEREVLRADWAVESARQRSALAFLRTVRSRDFRAANAAAKEFEGQDLVFLNAEATRLAALRAFNQPTANGEVGGTLGPSAARLVRRLCAPHRVPKWLTASSDELLAAVTAGRFSAESVPWRDHSRITAGWSRTQISQMLAAGRLDWLPERLPSDPTVEDLQAVGALLDRRSSPQLWQWIEEHVRATQNRHLLPQFVLAAPSGKLSTVAARVLLSLSDRPQAAQLVVEGGPALATTLARVIDAERAETMPQATMLSGALAVLAAMPPQQRPASLVEGATSALVKQIEIELDRDKPRHRARQRQDALDSALLGAAQTVIGLGPDAARALVQRLPSSTAATLLERAKGSALASAIVSYGDADAIRREIAKHDLSSGSPQAAWSALERYPELLSLLPDDHINVSETGNNLTRAALTLLAVRRNTNKVRRLAGHLGEAKFANAVAKAGTLLPPTSRTRGWLELSAALGTRGLKPLALAMARSQHDSAQGAKLDSEYRRFELPKDAGGKRAIYAPAPWLKGLQRLILSRILRSLGQHEAAHGFVRGRSIVTNAGAHVGKPVVVNCDIAQCFPSVRWSLVLAALKRDLSDRFCPAAISLLVDICTIGGALPTGAPTSPALLNRILLKTDEILSDTAAARGCSYTRYADDLTFSGGDEAVGMLAVTRSVIEKIGLKVDEKKTGIYRHGRRQVVTGLAVNARVSIPRRLRRRMRAAVHAVEQGREPAWHGKPDSHSGLAGRIAFLQAVNPADGERLRKRLRAAIKDSAGEADAADDSDE